MISGFNVYKLLVGEFFPKCVRCVNYKPGVVGNGFCKMYGDILVARTDKLKCSLEGKYFVKQNFVKNKQNEKNL